MNHYTLTHEIEIESDGEWSLDFITVADYIKTKEGIQQLLNAIAPDLHYQYLVGETIDGDDYQSTRADEWLEVDSIETVDFRNEVQVHYGYGDIVFYTCFHIWSDGKFTTFRSNCTLALRQQMEQMGITIKM